MSDNIVTIYGCLMANDMSKRSELITYESRMDEIRRIADEKRRKQDAYYYDGERVCDICGRDDSDFKCKDSDHKAQYYKREGKVYCGVCVYEFLGAHKECHEMTISEAMKMYGFKTLNKTF